MKILVLASSSPRHVVAAVADLRRRYPAAAVEVATARAHERFLTRHAVATRIVGEDTLELDRGDVRRAIELARPDLVVVPLAVPIQPLFHVLRCLRSLRRVELEVWAGRWLRARGRRCSMITIALYSVLAHPPVALVVRAGRVLDGALILAAQRVAGLLSSHRRLESTNRTCHVITSLARGGAEWQLAVWSRHTALDPERVVVLVLAPQVAPDVLVELEQAGVEIIVVSEEAFASRAGWLGMAVVPRFTWLLLLLKQLRRLRPSAVMSWLFLANVVTAPAARIAGIPWTCCSIRNQSAWKTWREYRAWWFRAADRGVARLADVVVCNSRAVADDFAGWAGAATSKLHVIPNGIHFDHLGVTAADRDHRRRRPENAAPLLLAVGRLAPEKDFELVLRAAVMLRDEGLELRVAIVGDGPCRRQLEALIAASRLGGLVELTGASERVADHYRSADLFVLSSRIEGMPNVLLEAQALGLPAVATRCGGASEIVIDGVTGLLVPVGDVAALAGAVASLLRDPELRHEMGARAYDRMQTCFSAARMAAAVDELLTTGAGFRPTP